MYRVEDLDNDFVGYTDDIEEVHQLKRAIRKAFGDDQDLTVHCETIQTFDLIGQYLYYLKNDLDIPYKAAEDFKKAKQEIAKGEI